MTPIGFDNLVRSDEAATAFLLKHCLQGKKRACPRCKCSKLYRLADQRERCAQCRYTFSDFAGRWLNIGGLRPVEWLILLRQFANGTSIQDIQAKLGVVYSTAYKAVTTLRRSIAAHATDADKLLPYILAEGPQRAYAGTGIVFGIESPQDLFHLRVVTGISLQDILAAHIRHVTFTFSIHTDPFAGYYALFFYQPQSHLENQGPNVKIWEDNPEVWNYFLEWRNRKRRTTAWQYILFSKEMEFRYDYRNTDSFETLLNYVCDELPQLPSSSTR